MHRSKALINSITSSARPTNGRRHRLPSDVAVFEIDHQLEFRGLLDRHIRRFPTLQNPDHEHSTPQNETWTIEAVGHEAAHLGKRTAGRDPPADGA